jgi:hypothetical protein
MRQATHFVSQSSARPKGTKTLLTSKFLGMDDSEHKADKKAVQLMTVFQKPVILRLVDLHLE